VILGTCIALYFFNSHPARLFLGDSGAQMLGFLLASIAILYEPRTGNQASTWFVPILIFAVPLFDMLLVTISRLKRNKKIHKASHDHTFHRLAQRGIPIQQSVLIMHGASLILSMIGFLCLNLPVIYANIVFGLVVCLGIAAFIELDKNYP
jgi:UDP-GlcNAc:undecaprenyl-phosphate GlcNAc-1-phosphate transferase